VLRLRGYPIPRRTGLVVAHEIYVGNAAFHPGSDPVGHLDDKEIETFRKNGAIVTAEEWLNTRVVRN
jgi:hypothetical protein